MMPRVIEMLQYMNSLSISPFAAIVRQANMQPENIMILRSDSAFPFYRCPAPVLLSPGVNMSIVQFIANDGTPVSFYLDKPIEVKPSVPFALLPIDDQCILYCRCELPLEKVDGPGAAKVPVIQGSLVVNRLCTFYLQEHGPGFFFSGERHHPYEMAYVSQGILHTVVNGQHFVLHQNEALFIPPEAWHVQYGEPNQSVSFFGTIFLCASPLPDAMLLRVLPEQKKAKELLCMLLGELDRKEVYQNDMLVTLFQNLLVQYARFSEGIQDHPVQLPSTANNENQILSNAMEYIAEHTRERIKVSVLARQCNVSPAYLSLLFKRHLGISPAAYMLQTRLEESRQLICNGTGNMAQIASTLCFSSAQHYSTAFKRQYGFTPKAYAKGLK